MPESVIAAAEQVEDAEPVLGPVTFGAVEDASSSVLARMGSMVAPAFKPLGFGDWKPTVATVLGLVAKEEVVAVFGVLFDEEETGLDVALANGFNEMSGGYGQLAAFAFMMFNLLCAPCFAAIGAIKREMNSPKWTWFALGYQCGLAYIASLIVFQLGRVLTGGSFTVATGFALAALIAVIYMLFRKNPNAPQRLNAQA